MELYSVLDKDSCTLDIPEESKEAALRKIAEIASRSAAGENVPSERIFEGLLGREEQGSTGFGEGIAIPHARIPGMSDFLFFVVTSRRGVDFDSVDKKKVHVFFVLLGPDDKPTEHLKILATVSRVLSSTNVKWEILSARSSTAMYEALLRHVRSVEGVSVAPRAMRALFVILYQEQFLHSILEFFIEEGIEGATIIDSFGMGEYISNVPLFASFAGFMNKSKNKSRTIIAMVPQERAEDIAKGIEEITGDLDKKESAMVFALDVPFYKGTMKMM